MYTATYYIHTKYLLGNPKYILSLKIEHTQLDVIHCNKMLIALEKIKHTTTAVIYIKKKKRKCAV